MTDKKRRTHERELYKELQDRGYDKDEDPCKYLKNRIKFQRELADMKEQWDRNWPHPKYPGGRHKDEIKRMRELADRDEARLSDVCNDECE